MTDTLISDLLDLPSQVRKGDFVLNLAKGVTDPDATLKDYVVTPLVENVKDQIVAKLLHQQKPVLLVHAGLIARYDLMILLENLRDQIGHDNNCPCLWVLVADDGLNPMPILDHKVIPLISNGQRANISEPWMDNYHRSGNTTTKKVF